MTTYPRYAVLIDGAFFLKKLRGHLGSFPAIEDVRSAIERIINAPDLSELTLLRIYFYDAPPATGEVTNPIDRSVVNLSATEIFTRNEALLKKIEMLPDVALRQGDTMVSGWRLGSRAMKSLVKTPRQIEARDLVPNINQKGVDLRIGLDLARLALRELVAAVVIVTGDSDIVPAMKFVRREGLRVYLDIMGHGVRTELRQHTDQLMSVCLPPKN